MTIDLSVETELSFDFDYEKVARDVIHAVLLNREFPYETEVSLSLVDDETIHEMTRDYREIDRATDVLSFPMHDFPAPGDFSLLEEESDLMNPETGEVLLGDIVISVDHVRAQAKEYGHSELREFSFLIAHSMLHLLGYDHMDDDEREEMESLQESILQGLDIKRN